MDNIITFLFITTFFIVLLCIAGIIADKTKLLDKFIKDMEE